MLDGVLKRRIDPVLDRLGAGLGRMGVGADTVTIAGFGLGLAAAVAIATGHPLIGLVLILVSRLADGLDGALARSSAPTDFGGYLDIVLDFAFYGAIPLAFAILDPEQNGVAAAVLLTSFYVNGASFLAFAVMAEKRQLSTDRRGVKSLYFTTGLAEATETYAAFALFCLFPGAFPVLASIFAAMCFVTFGARVLLAAKLFR
ncbi:CDP-alcohol phosphatidyltransferase family protein [Consotaella aegiceratis]|uniref:CDP-alcohol phosphatidyltransferase family protein n=1 Tax=Consotaella aegiceratis TaxID=3097961 RepID=UPI002F40081A